MQSKKRSLPVWHTVSRTLHELDRILRGQTIGEDVLASGQIKIPVLGIAGLVVVLGMMFGFCMAVFALVHGFENGVYARALAQTFASIVKVPLLFVLTLGITFPSLYVFNALVGSRLKIEAVLKLLLASLAVNIAVLASLGPILAFFSVSTSNYSFIVLLNVTIFATAGMLGLTYLVQSLNRLSVGPVAPLHDAERDEDIVIAPPEENESRVDEPSSLGPLDMPSDVVFSFQVRRVFGCWIFLFALVGSQLGWVLRPFIGSPNLPFQWFRARDSNFFESVFNSLFNLF